MICRGLCVKIVLVKCSKKCRVYNKMLLMRIMYHWQGTCVNKWGTLGVHFYIHVVQFMCDQIQQNIKAYGGCF